MYQSFHQHLSDLRFNALEMDGQWPRNSIPATRSDLNSRFPASTCECGVRFLGDVNSLFPDPYSPFPCGLGRQGFQSKARYVSVSNYSPSPCS
jgi:hypothetical protein